MKNLIFIDTETGGTDPDVHSLLQIGYVIDVDKDTILKNELNISRHNYIATKEALSINNIDLDMIREIGKSEDIVASTLVTHVHRTCSEKPTVVGHNVNFDINFLKKLFKRTGYDYDGTFSYRVVDTMSILRALNDAGVIPSSACNSKGAFEYFGIDNKNAHTALSDAEATRELYYKIITLLEDLEGLV